MVFEVIVKNIETTDRIRKFKTKITTIEELMFLYRFYKKDYSFVGFNIYERENKNELLIYVNDR